MKMIESPLEYRYYEMTLAVITSLVDAAFTACRYAQQPDENTDKYYDRIALTSAIMHERYSADLVQAFKAIVTSPENPTELQLEAGVGKLYWDNDYNDPYENGMDLLRETTHKISKNLAVAAFELDPVQITKFFETIKE